ncbi:MAG: hypothetical protein R3F19_26100 [Verrucomicrobiales bacterium]
MSVFVLLCGEGMAASTLSKLATAEWERTVGADGEQNTGAAAARRTLMGKPGTDTPTGMALVRLQRALLEQALEQAPTTAIASVFFALIPATALPLRPLDELGRLLQADGRSRFVLDDAGNRGKIEGAGERRIATSPSSHGHAGENETVSEWPAVIPASEVLRHSPWMILNRRDAELIVRNDLTGCCVGMAEPERTYVGTVLRASGVMVDGELETSVVPLVTVAEELKSRAGQLGTGAWFG